MKPYTKQDQRNLADLYSEQYDQYSRPAIPTSDEQFEKWYEQHPDPEGEDIEIKHMLKAAWDAGYDVGYENATVQSQEHQSMHYHEI